MIHELKIEPQYFERILSREKTFEIRKNDRGFNCGDYLELKEFDPLTKKHTGREIESKIGFVTNYGQKDDYVVFSLIGIRPLFKNIL